MQLFCPVNLKSTGTIVVGWKDGNQILIYRLVASSDLGSLKELWSKYESCELPLIELGHVETQWKEQDIGNIINLIKWKIDIDVKTLKLIFYNKPERTLQFKLMNCAHSLERKERQNNYRILSEAQDKTFRFFSEISWIKPRSIFEFDELSIFLDISLGICAGAVIAHSAGPIANILTDFHNYYNQEQLPSFIAWLMGYPAGLKLNSNLSKFIGEMYLWMLSIWNQLMSQKVLSNLRLIVWCTSLSGLTGLQNFLLILGAFTRASCLHWELFFTLQCRLYAAELAILGSLWRLLRGKKWNVLHQRLDAADYTLDQLLLGTIMFTVFAFLLPTILVYHILFAVTQLTMTTIYASINSLIFLISIFENASTFGTVYEIIPHPSIPNVWMAEKSTGQFTANLKWTINEIWSIFGHHFEILIFQNIIHGIRR